MSLSANFRFFDNGDVRQTPTVPWLFFKGDSQAILSSPSSVDVADAIAISDAFSFLVTKQLSDSVSSSDSSTTNLGRTRTFLEDLTSIPESFVAKIISKTVSDSIDAVESISRIVARSFVDADVPVEDFVVSFLLHLVFDEIVAGLLGQISESFGVVRTAFLDASDSISSSDSDVLVHGYTQLFVETFAMSDALDTLSKLARITFSDADSLIEDFAQSHHIFPTYSDVVAFSDEFHHVIPLALSDVLTESDVLAYLMLKNLSDVAPIIDFGSSLSKAMILKDSITLADDSSENYGQTLTLSDDASGISDDFSLQSGNLHIFGEHFLVREELIKMVARELDEVVEMSDSISKLTATEKSDEFDFVEAFQLSFNGAFRAFYVGLGDAASLLDEVSKETIKAKFDAMILAENQFVAQKTRFENSAETFSLVDAVFPKTTKRLSDILAMVDEQILRAIFRYRLDVDIILKDAGMSKNFTSGTPLSDAIMFEESFDATKTAVNSSAEVIVVSDALLKQILKNFAEFPIILSEPSISMVGGSDVVGGRDETLFKNQNNSRSRSIR